MANDCPCCLPPCEIKVSPTFHTHMKIRDDGSEIMWIADHGDALHDIVYDETNSRLYISSQNTTNNVDDAYFRRINPVDSSIIWSKLSPFNDVSHGLALMSGGDVIVARRGGSPGANRDRWDSDGVNVWSRSSGLNPNGVATDPSDKIYIIEAGNSPSISKFPSTGLSPADWSQFYGDGNGTFLAVTANGTQVAVVGSHGTLPTGKSLRVLDSSGALLWSKNDNDTLRAAAFSPNGNLIVVGDITGLPGFPNIPTTTYCYDSAGVMQWHTNHGAGLMSVATDSGDNVYVGGAESTGYYLGGVLQPTTRCSVRKYDSAGVEQWNFDYLLGRGIGTVNSITVDNNGYVYIAGSRVDTIIQP